MKKLVSLSLLVMFIVAMGTVAKARDDVSARGFPKIESKINVFTSLFEASIPVIHDAQAATVAGFASILSGSPEMGLSVKNPVKSLAIIYNNSPGNYPDADERQCYRRQSKLDIEKPPGDIHPVKLE